MLSKNDNNQVLRATHQFELETLRNLTKEAGGLTPEIQSKYRDLDNFIEITESVPYLAKIPVLHEYGPLIIHCIVRDHQGKDLREDDEAKLNPREHLIK